MAYEPKDGSGALFKNDKGDNPARPDYRGDLMVGGVVYEVSGWIRPVASNPEKKFLSLAAKPKQSQQQAPRKPSQDGAKARDTKGSGFDDMESDIPF